MGRLYRASFLALFFAILALPGNSFAFGRGVPRIEVSDPLERARVDELALRPGDTIGPYAMSRDGKCLAYYLFRNVGRASFTQVERFCQGDFAPTLIESRRRPRAEMPKADLFIAVTPEFTRVVYETPVAVWNDRGKFEGFRYLLTSASLKDRFARPVDLGVETFSVSGQSRVFAANEDLTRVIATRLATLRGEFPVRSCRYGELKDWHRTEVVLVEIGGDGGAVSIKRLSWEIDDDEAPGEDEPAHGIWQAEPFDVIATPDLSRVVISGQIDGLHKGSECEGWVHSRYTEFKGRFLNGMVTVVGPGDHVSKAIDLPTNLIRDLGAKFTRDGQYLLYDGFTSWGRRFLFSANLDAGGISWFSPAGLVGQRIDQERDLVFTSVIRWSEKNRRKCRARAVFLESPVSSLSDAKPIGTSETCFIPELNPNYGTFRVISGKGLIYVSAGESTRYNEQQLFFLEFATGEHYLIGQTPQAPIEQLLRVAPNGEYALVKHGSRNKKGPTVFTWKVLEVSHKRIRAEIPMEIDKESASRIRFSADSTMVTFRDSRGRLNQIPFVEVRK